MVTVEAQRSRAQITRDSVEIILAVNEAAPAIVAILKENDIELPAATWDDVFPYWLLATHKDHAIGCCQVALSKPVGYVEFMFVRPSVPFKLRAIALRKLILQSMATLQLHGCQYVGGVVEKGNSKFANVLENLNFVNTYNADMYAKRLA